MMSKKTILIFITAVIIVLGVGFIAYYLLNPRYIISGKITDAENGQAVQGVKIQAGKQETLTDENGAFEIKRVKKDTQLIFTVTPEYQPIVESIDYQGGDKEGLFTIKIMKDLELIPTGEERANRVKTDVEQIIKDVMFGRFEEAYDALDPDNQKLISKEEYVKQSQDAFKSVSLTDYKIVDVRFLDQWHSTELNKDYFNVAEVEIAFTYTRQASGVSQTMNRVTHAVKVDGKWRWFYSPSSLRAI